MLGVKTHHVHGSPLYWVSRLHGRMLYTWGENGTLRAFSLKRTGATRLIASGTDVASADLADVENAFAGRNARR